MKNNIIKIGFAAMIILCGWLSYLVFFGKSLKDDHTKRQANPIINEAKIEAEVISRAVDRQGFSKTVAVRKTSILHNGDISKLPISQSVLDSLRLDNLSKDSRLQQASVVIGKLEAKLRAVQMTDSLHRTYYLYKDDFATAKFTPDSAGGTFDIDWRLKLIRQDYKKRKHLFSPYVYYTDILSPDPRISIAGLQNLSIESRQSSRWAVGLQAGYHYVPTYQKFLPSIGIGLSYNLIRF